MRFQAFTNLSESPYKGNLGFQEMVSFYRQASEEEIDLMEKIVSKGDWDGFRALIKKVIGVTLKEAGQTVRANWQGTWVTLDKEDHKGRDEKAYWKGAWEVLNKKGKPSDEDDEEE